MRIARLYAVYLLTFLVGCAYFIGAPFPYSKLTTIREALALQSLGNIGDQVFYFDGPSWSVSAEFFFYAMFPFIAWAIHRLGVGKTVTRIVLAWLLLLALRVGIASRFDTHVAYAFDWWFIYIARTSESSASSMACSSAICSSSKRIPSSGCAFTRAGGPCSRSLYSRF
ncbi:unnamed protein product [Candidatus Paraburkholderia kirkii UZHbot1]|uniref:WGS project CAFE00000000 data, contig bkir_c84 n=1 Tax=Candidatus Paraburkholderia kirkii UZHbot1 TaxID=1055526 RepID=U3UB39_9BURK|nr:unnamed protein product [Candidatus Paraburkholderia kirkii UZHbot1]